MLVTKQVFAKFLLQDWMKVHANPVQHLEYIQFISVQSLSCVWLFVTPWTAARQASLFITNS